MKLYLLLIVSIVLFSLTLVNTNECLEKIQKNKKKFIIDEDGAMEDISAVMYALLHPNVDVEAVLVSGSGETKCKFGKENVKNALNFVNYKDIPIVCGPDYPLDGYFEFPQILQNKANSNLFNMEQIENPITRNELNIDASDYIINYLKKQKQEQEACQCDNQKISLIFIGPITNLALAYLKSPQLLIEEIDKIYFMGGVVLNKGNIPIPGICQNINNTDAEWNVFVDPVATKIIFNSELSSKLKLITLDGTKFVPITHKYARYYKSKVKSKFAQYALKIMGDEIELENESDGLQFWDSLTVAEAIDNDLCYYAKLPLDVKLQKIEDESQTLFKKHKNFPETNHEGKQRSLFQEFATGGTYINKDQGKFIDVCIWTDRSKLESRLIQIFNQEPQ